MRLSFLKCSCFWWAWGRWMELTEEEGEIIALLADLPPGERAEVRVLIRRRADAVRARRARAAEEVPAGPAAPLGREREGHQ